MRKTRLALATPLLLLAACQNDLTSPAPGAAPSGPSLAVNVDYGTGIGFVGKGDVQLAFGWNNNQLQKNAGGVTFFYDATTTYTAVCTFTTGEGTRGEKIHNVDHKTRTSVIATIAYDARVRNQITGFNLKGFGETVTTGGAVPLVGDACMGNPGHEGTWSSVEQTGSVGGLFVSHGGTSVALPNTETTTL
jgi:hypothetical protein